MKKHVRFDRVEIPARKGKAPESILKHPDHAGAVRETHNSAAGPTTPLRIIVIAPAVTFPTIKNTATSNTSGPQYRYSTPVEDPTITCKVVNCTLDVPVFITQHEPLSISPEAHKQYKELTTTQRISAGTTEVGKLEEVPSDSLAVYSSSTIHNPDGSNDLRVGRDSIPLCSIFPLVEGKLTVECILHSGCQIVAMNNTIWEQLGNNLQVERALKMEAANSTITKTHGRLRNVWFTFNLSPGTSHA
jgi:hypothetical protein